MGAINNADKGTMGTKTQPWLSNPKQKIDWALKLLYDKGFKIEEAQPDARGQPRFAINGEVLMIAQIYQLVTKYPEWNDRLGLGTARLRRVSE
jgi:hypothetical protein